MIWFIMMLYVTMMVFYVCITLSLLLLSTVAREVDHYELYVIMWVSKCVISTNSNKQILITQITWYINIMIY